MDFGGMRQWLKAHNEEYMIIPSRYETMVDEKECEAVEYRLLLLRGDMDYTTYALEKAENYDADEPAALRRMLERVCWETHRDVRVKVDTDRAVENGRRYLSGSD